MSPIKFSPALAIAVLFFFLMGFLTDPIHDFFFFAHTSIQDHVEVCRNDDCWTEDGVRAYSSHLWALAGNGFALFMLAMRGVLSLIVYLFFEERNKGNYILDVLAA